MSSCSIGIAIISLPTSITCYHHQGEASAVSSAFTPMYQHLQRPSRKASGQKDYYMTTDSSFSTAADHRERHRDAGRARRSRNRTLPLLSLDNHEDALETFSRVSSLTSSEVWELHFWDFLYCSLGNFCSNSLLVFLMAVLHKQYWLLVGLCFATGSCWKLWQHIAIQTIRFSKRFQVR